MADDLGDILATAKQVAPEVPDQVWQRLEFAIRQQHGAARVYIAKRSKGLLLQQIEDHSHIQDTQRLAEILGVTPRRVRELKRLL